MEQDLTKESKQEVIIIKRLINERPRETHGFKTQIEAIKKYFRMMMLRLQVETNFSYYLLS